MRVEGGEAGGELAAVLQVEQHARHQPADFARAAGRAEWRACPGRRDDRSRQSRIRAAIHPCERRPSVGICPPRTKRPGLLDCIITRRAASLEPAINSVVKSARTGYTADAGARRQDDRAGRGFFQDRPLGRRTTPPSPDRSGNREPDKPASSGMTHFVLQGVRRVASGRSPSGCSLKKCVDAASGPARTPGLSPVASIEYDPICWPIRRCSTVIVSAVSVTALVIGMDDVRLVVNSTGQPGDQPQRHQLADEDHASLGAAANIEPQIDLGEVTVAGPGDCRGLACREKSKATRLTKADPSRRSSSSPVGRRGQEQVVRDRVGGKEQVRPVGGQEWPARIRVAPHRLGSRGRAATPPPGESRRPSEATGSSAEWLTARPRWPRASS